MMRRTDAATFRAAPGTRMCSLFGRVEVVVMLCVRFSSG